MSAPVLNSLSDTFAFAHRTRVRAEGARWALTCGLLILPLAAIFHHAVFYRQTCMLNPFGADYSGSALVAWLSRDPSLWLAMLVSLATFQLGSRFEGFRPLVLPFALAFLPLAVWIWDIPLTGRILCHTFHDQRVPLMDGLALRSRHFYLVGGLAYSAFLARTMWAYARHQRARGVTLVSELRRGIAGRRPLPTDSVTHTAA